MTPSFMAEPVETGVPEIGVDSDTSGIVGVGVAGAGCDISTSAKESRHINKFKFVSSFLT